MSKTRNYIDVLRKKLSENKRLASAVEGEVFNARIAMQVYEARQSAQLTQQQLAEAIGTQQSVIARLESADYDGYTISTLRKIGQACNQPLRIEFYAKGFSLECPSITVRGGQWGKDWGSTETEVKFKTLQAS